jgi:hypothetical protein
MMMLSLDNLAHRYGILPTEALMRGSTLDLRVLDVSARWQQHQQRGDTLPRATTLNQQDMLNMLKKAQESKVAE